MSSFHLFPPGAPDVEIKGSRIPIRKGKKPSLGSSSSIPLGDLNGSDEVDTGLRGIRRDMTIQPSRKVHTKSNSGTMLGPTPTPKPPSSWTLRSVNQPNDRASPSNVSSSTTLANNNSYTQIPRSGPGRSSTPETDINIPMRSIFPRYNPNIPLNQQHYYPQFQLQSQPQLSKLPPFRHKPKPQDLTLSPEPKIDRDLGPKTVPASVMDFPAWVRDSGEMEIRYSSVDELKRLWEVANGQRPEGLGGFNLRLSRTDSSIFTLGTSHHHRFYTIALTTTNTMSISRTNPSKPHTTIPITTLPFSPDTHHKPPNDGLVTTIFSHLAALLAVEQADELARQQQLSPGEKLKAEREAVRRAEKMESCQLIWDCESRVYVLLHPSSQQQEQQQQQQRTPALIGAAGIPLSPSPSITRSSPGTGTLHVTVSTPSTDNDTENQSPIILITTPTSPRQNTPPASLLATPTPRTSTLPLTDTDRDFHSPLAIASLDLSTITLGINAAKIVEAVPSLFALDVVVAALLAVGVGDERANPVVMGMDVDVTSASQYDIQAELGGGGGVGRVDEGDEARGGENTGRIESAWPDNNNINPNNPDIDANTKQSRTATTLNTMKTSLSNFRTWTRSLPTKLNLRAPKPNRSKPFPKTPQPRTRDRPEPKQTVLEEFDLEHYGRHGPADSPREGEKLPGVTRGILRVLFCGLEIIIRWLTGLVKLLAWVVVTVSGWVSRRF